MDLSDILKNEIGNACSAVFGAQVDTFQIQPTNSEFEGSHTLVCFPLTKISKKKPEETAQLVGQWLVDNTELVDRFNVVKGFLNLVLKDSIWIEVLRDILQTHGYGVTKPTGQEIMVEFSSPNTNKPLHLGHLRNNFLGWSVAAIYEAIGYQVHKV
ncbi:MAG: arginine--tRNA ligase, partial [Cyclobacteriaceae bacterium]